MEVLAQFKFYNGYVNRTREDKNHNSYDVSEDHVDCPISVDSPLLYEDVSLDDDRDFGPIGLVNEGSVRVCPLGLSRCLFHYWDTKSEHFMVS